MQVGRSKLHAEAFYRHLLSARPTGLVTMSFYSVPWPGARPRQRTQPGAFPSLCSPSILHEVTDTPGRPVFNIQYPIGRGQILVPRLSLLMIVDLGGL